MYELTREECYDIEGGFKLSTVIMGAGIALIGIACMTAAAATTPVILGGYVAYEIGVLVFAGGFVEK